MGNNLAKIPLYRMHELSIRTLYAEVKERASTSGNLLPGTPGTLVKACGKPAHEYWYRSYYPLPKKRSEEFVGFRERRNSLRDDAEFDGTRRLDGKSRYRHSRSSAIKLRTRASPASLVELHNRQIFKAGLIVVGTLAYMSWLNEYGAMATAARTQDIDLARRQRLNSPPQLHFCPA